LDTCHSALVDAFKCMVAEFGPRSVIRQNFCLFSLNGVVTSHDDDGNLLFAADPLYGGNMALSYNSRNQLLSAAVGGVSGSFTYDAEGHRQSVTHAGQTSTFTVNPAAELSQVLVPQVEGGQRTWAVYGLGLLYEVEIESVGEPEFQLVGGDIMTLVSQVTERLRVHHYDQTGNTVAITDGQGRDVLWVQYDAYGAVVHAESPTQADGGVPVRPEVNALADGLQRALAVTPWLYVGEHGVMTDPTGLLHMRARYYHPGLRRFLNADPIQFEGGMNWYGYAGGNPVMGMDPLGLEAWEQSRRYVGREGWFPHSSIFVNVPHRDRTSGHSTNLYYRIDYGPTLPFTQSVENNRQALEDIDFGWEFVGRTIGSGAMMTANLAFMAAHAQIMVRTGGSTLGDVYMTRLSSHVWAEKIQKGKFQEINTTAAENWSLVNNVATHIASGGSTNMLYNVALNNSNQFARRAAGEGMQNGPNMNNWFIPFTNIDVNPFPAKVVKRN
jgi:RHS repeat-associated protein